MCHSSCQLLFATLSFSRSPFYAENAAFFATVPAKLVSIIKDKIYIALRNDTAFRDSYNAAVISSEYNKNYWIWISYVIRPYFYGYFQEFF